MLNEISNYLSKYMKSISAQYKTIVPCVLDLFANDSKVEKIKNGIKIFHLGIRKVTILSQIGRK